LLGDAWPAATFPTAQNGTGGNAPTAKDTAVFDLAGPNPA